MHTPSKSRLAAFSVALALVGAPLAAQSSHDGAMRPIASVASTTTSSSWAGVYRLQLTGPKGQISVIRLLVERVGNELSGTIINEDNAASHADVVLDGDAMRANALTSGGEGTMVLRETSDGVAGTFRVGKLSFTVTGQRSA